MIIIIGNFCYDSGGLQRAPSSVWHTPASPRPKKTRMSNSRVKTMLIVFFDMRGLIHKEFLPHTVNVKFYKKVLQRLHTAIKRRRQDLTHRWRLHHDNASAHTALHSWPPIWPRQIYVTLIFFLEKENKTYLNLSWPVAPMVTTSPNPWHDKEQIRELQHKGSILWYVMLYFEHRWAAPCWAYQTEIPTVGEQNN